MKAGLVEDPDDRAGPLGGFGRYSPGASAAAVSFDGQVVKRSSSILNIELGGLDPGTQYDQLAIAHSATLDGSLEVGLLDYFVPAPGDRFDILTANTISGTFVAYDEPALLGASALHLDGQKRIFQEVFQTPVMRGVCGKPPNAISRGRAIRQYWRTAEPSVGLKVTARREPRPSSSLAVVHSLEKCGTRTQSGDPNLIQLITISERISSWSVKK